MKVQTQSKRFYQSLSIAIAVAIGVSVCEMATARPRGGGGGSLPRRANIDAPSINRVQPSEQREAIQAPRVEQFQQRVQEIKASPQFQQQVQEIKANSQFQQQVQEIKANSQFQQQVQEIKANSQFQQRVQEIKASPQFQQRVQEIRESIQANPEAQQSLRELQQSRQQFKVERREDWQNYLNETRDDRQDNRYYYDPYYWNIGYGYNYSWGGYYPSYFVPLSTLSVNLFASDFDRYHYDSGRNYALPGIENYTSPVPESARNSSLPEGFISVALNSLTYYYYLGTFYLQDVATGNYAVTPAPVGAVVPYIPTEYQKVTINGAQYYQYAGIYYRPTFKNGQLLYEVVRV